MMKRVVRPDPQQRGVNGKLPLPGAAAPVGVDFVSTSPTGARSSQPPVPGLAPTQSHDRSNHYNDQPGSEPTSCENDDSGGDDDSSNGTEGSDEEDGGSSSAGAQDDGEFAARLLSLADSMKAKISTIDAARRAGSSSRRKREAATSSVSKEKAPAQKKRKATHTIRREEIAALVQEVNELQATLVLLTGQVVTPHPLKNKGKGDAAVHPQVSNALLREAVYEQQLRFACARSMITQYLSTDLASPVHIYIHLPRAKSDRRRVLLGVREQYFRFAMRFMEERCRYLDLTRPHATLERFVADNEDACAVRLFVDQLPGTLTIPQVLMAMSSYMSNVEINLMDCGDHITIREDEDTGDPLLAQHKLVTSTTHGVVVETNTVRFAHYDPLHDVGLVVATFVDEDDLHPYRPADCIRQNVTVILKLFREGGKVVLTRWAHVKTIHNPELVTSEASLLALRENVGKWSEIMLPGFKKELGLEP